MFNKFIYTQLIAVLLIVGTTSSIAFDDASDSPPLISAKGYLLMDFDSGELLVKTNIKQRLEPASLTKVMTALVIFKHLKKHKISLRDQTHVSHKARSMIGSRSFLEEGSKISVEQLLKCMIIQSGNDAAIVLAEHVSGSEAAFVQLMNKEAHQLGMQTTHFQNVTGLSDPNHYTSAYDLALLAKAIIQQYPKYYRYFSMVSYTHNKISQKNRNKLLFWDPTVDGIKTGFTNKAGYCLLASAKRKGRRLISVVLSDYSAKARALSSKTLLEYGFRYYGSDTTPSTEEHSYSDPLDSI